MKRTLFGCLIGLSILGTTAIAQDENSPSVDRSRKYYCKDTHMGRDRWVRCSYQTGQCFGERFQFKWQCERALPFN